MRIATQDLTRLLSRLQQQVLGSSSWESSATVNDDLRTSVYLRRKTGANLEHARALLLRLEHDAASIKVAARRSSLIATLRAHRATIATLNQALLSLDALSESDSEDESPAPAPAPRTASPPTIRARVAPAPTASSLETREKALSASALEQEAIKSSLVTLAADLKASNIDFGAQLAAERAVLDAAAAGLDRNALGMEGAERRMGMLRRMTEGKGFFERLKLYGFIALLWVAAFVLVFLGPKLRF